MISVVIPAYNEEKLIGRCLDALVKQKTSEKFEVIFVNNNSTDNTAKIAKTYINKLTLKVISEKTKGRGPARKRGFDEAKGDIIASTDADTAVPPNWIENLSAYLTNSDAVAVSGTCKITDCDNLTNIIFNIFQPFSMKLYKLIFGHYWLSGFNFAIYRNAYKKTQGFNPKLNIQEDIDLSFKVSKVGSIKLITNLPVEFSGRRFKKGLIKGLIPYLSTFVSYFFYKDKKVVLSDIR